MLGQAVKFSGFGKCFYEGKDVALREAVQVFFRG